MNTSTVAILGANGFIGSHLTDILADKGYQVRAFDAYYDDGDSSVRFCRNANVSVCNGNFLNNNDIAKTLDGADFVYHLISTTTPQSADADPFVDVDTNIRGSVSALKACAESGSVKKVVFLSSGGTVYGEMRGELPIDENCPTFPVSPYGIGKLAVEGYLRYFKHKYGLDYTVFRASNVYGERQSMNHRQGVIPIFINQMLRGEPIIVLGDGSMVRDYLYVRDLAEILSKAIESRFSYDLYNIGSGMTSSVNELVRAIETVSGKKAEIEHQPTPPSFIQKSVLDVSRYLNEFPGTAFTGLEEGIRKTYEYYCELFG